MTFDYLQAPSLEVLSTLGFLIIDFWRHRLLFTDDGESRSSNSGNVGLALLSLIGMFVLLEILMRQIVFSL